jgi:hypothetical protein
MLSNDKEIAQRLVRSSVQDIALCRSILPQHCKRVAIFAIVRGMVQLWGIRQQAVALSDLCATSATGDHIGVFVDIDPVFIQRGRQIDLTGISHFDDTPEMFASVAQGLHR